MKLALAAITGLFLISCSSSLKVSPPQDLSGRGFSAENKQLLKRAQTTLQQILSVQGPRTIENTLEPYNQLMLDLGAAYGNAGLFGAVHPQKDIREAALANEQILDQFETDLSLNVQLYKALQSIDLSQADVETQFFVEKVLRNFRRSGVDKDEATRKKIATLQADLSKIRQSFSQNIRNDVRFIYAHPTQMKGFPKDFIAAHPPEKEGDHKGKIKISTNYPDYFPTMNYAQSSSLRKKMYKAMMSRAYPQNVKPLKKLLQKRYELAQRLGYKNWAHFITEDKMMKSHTAAKDFIEKINALAKKRSTQDYKEVLEEKRRVYPKATRIHSWEYRYWSQRLKETKYKINAQETRQYFEFNRVKKGIFAITQKLFGVTYKPVNNVQLWHPDVEAWDIFDRGRHLGRFYLDLFPRDNKFKHNAQFGFRTGISGYQLPQAVLVTNFPNPHTSQGPALMEHNQVETFLHEFGHLLHTMFSGQHRWEGLSGIKTEWDFAEVPSQMLEEWVWDTSTLQSFATHYETNQPIPTQLIEKMKAAKDFGVGISVRNQMFLAALSLNLYNKNPQNINVDRLTRQLQNRYSVFNYVNNTHRAYSFGHLDGYSAMYYTYMWSQVIAKDLFSEFQKNGLFDPATAQQYRKKILNRGGSNFANKLVEDFLGRPFSYDAFKHWLN